MSNTKQQLWTKFGGKGFFARMAENAKNDGEGNEISQTYATKDTATSSTAGLMSGADKAKLDAIGQGAEANVIESISANGVALPVSNKNVDIPVATDQADGLLPHEKLALIPAAAQPGADRVYSFDDANGTSWQTVVKDYIGDLVLDQTGTPVAGEDGSLLYSEDAVQLWLSYKGTEFGARRAYEDHTGENIHDSIAAKPDMAQVNTAIEAALANYGGFQVVNIGKGGEPAVDNPSTKYIYLTKDEQSQAEDPYTEWIYTDNGQWEKIGETSVGIMTGATAQSNGKSGLVPAPTISDRDKFLKGDGTWSVAGSDMLPGTEPVASGHWYAPMRTNRGSGASSEWKLGVYGTGAGTFNSFTITAESQGNGVLVKESVFNNASNGQVLYKSNNVGFAFKTVNEIPSSTSSDSGKVLTVNQSGSAEWAQLNWTDGDYTIPPQVITIGGREYRIVTIGNQQWMAENLDHTWEGLTVDSRETGNYYVQRKTHYSNNDRERFGQYGRMYDWYAAVNLNDNLASIIGAELAADGWKVPATSDFDTLIAYVGGTSVAGTVLKQAAIGGTDDYGFGWQPGGFGQNSGGNLAYYRQGQWGIIWTLNENSSLNAYCYAVMVDTTTCNSRSEQKLNEASIRLVRNLA